MVASAPYNIANGAAASGSTTFSVTVGTGSGSPVTSVPAGDLVVVIVDNSAGDTVSSVVDSKSNTYTQVFTAGGSNQRVTYWAALIATALTSTDTFTATYSATGGAKFIIVKGATGIASATPDKTINAGGTSTAPSSGATATLSQASEIAIGVIQNAAATLSAPSYGTALTVTNGASATELDEFVSSTSPITTSATLSTSVLWQAATATWETTLPSITTPSLPAGTSGSPYSASLSETGAVGTQTYSITSGSLTGSGVSMSSAGVFSGTGGTAGSYPITVQLLDGNGNTTSAPFTLVINPPAGGSTPYLVGSQEVSAPSVSIVVGTMAAGASGSAQGVAAGDMILVSTNAAGTGTQPTSVIDSQGNTYNLLTTTSAEFDQQVWVCQSSVAALTAGVDTITGIWAGSGAHGMMAVGLHGVGNVDVQVVASAGSSGSVSVASGTLSNSPELVCVFEVNGNSGNGITWGGSPAVSSSGMHQGSNFYCGVAAFSQSVTTSTNYTGSLSASPKWSAILVSVTETTPVPNATIPYGFANGGHSSATSVTVPVNTSTQQGYNLWVGVAASANETITVSDTQGNTYSQVKSETTNATVSLYVFECQGAAALSGSDSITVTSSGSTNLAVNGVADPSGGITNITVGATGTTGSPTVSTGTLSYPEQNIIVFVADTSTGGPVSWTSPLSSAGPAGTTSSNRCAVAQDQVRVGTAVTCAGTITSSAWSIIVVSTEFAVPEITTIFSDGVSGDSYSQNVEATGGLPNPSYTIALASGTLPAGTSLASGVVSGSLSTPGSYTFALSVGDGVVSTTMPSQTVTIMPASSQATVNPGQGTNLLTPADSDFEVTGITWTSYQNASSVTRGTHAYFCGSRSLKWTATADGLTAVATGFYPVTAGAPYIASLFNLITSNQAPLITLAINWYNGVTLIGSSMAQSGTIGPLLWDCQTLATVAPANATQAKLVLTVGAANAGDVNYADLAFLSQSGQQVLIDFVNPSFGSASVAGQNFMDVSAWVRMDTGFSLTRGRQDAISEITAGSASFPLENDVGWFTKGNSNSAAVVMGGQVQLQHRCQINFTDEAGTWYTRFDGQVSDIQYALDPTGNTNIATVYVSDILAPINRQDALTCWTKEQVLQGDPILHWTLNDQPSNGFTSFVSGGSNNGSISTGTLFQAAESSGNNGPALKVIKGDATGAATIGWASTVGGVEILADTASAGLLDGAEYWPAGSIIPSSQTRGLDSGGIGPFTTTLQNVYLAPVLTNGSALNQFVNNQGYRLEAQLPTPLNPNATPSGDFSVEAWGLPDQALSSKLTQNMGPFTLFSLGSGRLGSDTLVVGLFWTGTVYQMGAKLYNNSPAFAAKNFSGSSISSIHSATLTPLRADTVQTPHHFVVSVQGDFSSPTLTCYVDGVQAGSFALPAGTVFDTICVGGAYGGWANWYGGISLVSVYPSQMSQSQVLLNCQLGQYGAWEMTTDDAVALLATFADIPSYWNGVTAQHAGLTLTDYYDVNGSNPYNAMTVYEQTEKGLLFVSAAGQLMFHTRDFRMGHGAPDLVLPPDSYSEDLKPEVLDTYQVNENAISSAAFPQGAYFLNEESQDLYGVYAPNPISSPIELAHVSWQRAFSFFGLSGYEFWPDPNMLDAAAWEANAKSDPWYALGGITVDLLTVDPTWGINISNCYAVEIDDMLGLGGNLPASLPNEPGMGEFFIEGISETYNQQARSITYYVSSAITQRAWIPGDSTYGVLSQTARIGVSSTDLNTPPAFGKDVSHDAGPPYWTPNFENGMNSPGGNNNGFVGMNDIRGLVYPLQNILQPPMAVMYQAGNNQTINSGAIGTPQIDWDTLYNDSVDGMSIVPGWPNWYVCVVPGFYEIDAGLVWSQQTAPNFGGQAWIVVAEAAAQALAAGTGTPQTVGQYVCPVGEIKRRNGVSFNTVSNPTTRMYLGLGDMITLGAEQDSGSNWTSGTSLGGSFLNIRFVGFATGEDRAQVNSALSNGGTVVTPTTTSHGTFTYHVQHTFSHYGQNAKGYTPFGLRNEDGTVYVGAFPNSNQSTQYSLLRFPHAQMQADLGGKTIVNVTLTGTNIYSVDSSTTLMGGYYYTSGEWTTWEPGNQSPAPKRDVWTQQFNEGQTKTFVLPALQFQTDFITDNAFGIMLGDDQSGDRSFYGRYNGGTGSWTLVVSF